MLACDASKNVKTLTTIQSQWASAAKDNMLNTKLFTFLFLFTISITSHAETEVERKAGIAGKYWGAVIMAAEFAKTSCGRTANLDDRFTNVQRVVSEIRAKFSASLKSDMDRAFSYSEEQKARAEMRDLLAMMDLNKCEAAKSVIVTTFRTAESNWQAVR